MTSEIHSNLPDGQDKQKLNPIKFFRHDCEEEVTLIPLEDAKEDLTIKIVA